MKKKIIQVPMPYDLLADLDAAADERGDSRSSLIREACSAYITRLRNEKAVAAYVRSYAELPDTEEERQWAQAGARLAAEVWGDEDWSKEYEESVKADEELAKRERETR